MTALRKYQPRTVVPIKPNYTKKLKNADAVMAVIRFEMHNHYPEDLAEEIGVSIACIYCIRNGKTKWPRPKTFFGLIDALGLEMRLERA